MGTVSKLPCGGGEEAVHSRVLLCQGLRLARGPANKLRKKLARKEELETIPMIGQRRSS